MKQARLHTGLAWGCVIAAICGFLTEAASAQTFPALPPLATDAARAALVPSGSGNSEADSLELHARASIEGGDYGQARGLLEKALAIRESAAGNDGQATARCLLTLAELLAAQGGYASARPLAMRAYAILKSGPLPKTSGVVSLQTRLAKVLQGQRELALAEELWREALAVARTLNPQHAELPLMLTQLARIRIEAKDFRKATAYYEELASAANLRQITHGHALELALEMAGLQRDLSRPDQAIALLLQTLDNMRLADGEDSPRQVLPRRALAQL
jgi:tetratricopeptide (TPR) repeat protein